MNGFIFGTKAETLQNLYQNYRIGDAKICKPCFFTVSAWRSGPEGILASLMDEMRDSGRVIVRSSAAGEDSGNESLAGKYTSLVCDCTERELKQSIENVIRSYGRAGDDDEVLVQKAVEEVSCSGVVFSLDPDTGGRYYRIEYDDSTGSSSTVTSGKGVFTKLYYWFSGSKHFPGDPRLGKLCRTVRELVRITGREALDVEFLFSGEELYILQVRPLIFRTELADLSVMRRELTGIRSQIKERNRPDPFLLGKRTLFGVMPDWNPAEMIGIHPRNLAMSLYKELITDRVWAEQRRDYGSRDLTAFPLMIDFCGHPYIDVRVSFNSFIPAGLDPATAEKLVDYYLGRLEGAPDKHDKVEFDILFTCCTLHTDRMIRELGEHGFSSSEIEKITTSLKMVTKRIIDPEKGFWRTELSKVKLLETKRAEIEHSSLPVVEKIRYLMEDCKKYGTLPFAGLARSAFIAVQMLDSMVTEGFLTESEKDSFMSGLQTVNSSMKRDHDTMDKDRFLKTYGFLRPGTYDICSRRYDEAPDVYFSWNGEGGQRRGPYDSAEKPDPFILSPETKERIRKKMIDTGLGEDVTGLFAFIKGAVEGRETAKFVFTGNVSEILKKFGEWGEDLGFSRDDLSYADIRIIREICRGTVDEKKALQESVENGKRLYRDGKGMVLPPLIRDEDSVTAFHIPDSEPNFITQKRVWGKLKRIGRRIDSSGLAGHILLMESADPGYDWIFSHDIRGFITKYGGANSHMAVRAAERNLPAVLGAGEKLFRSLLDADAVEIDAPKKQVRIIR